MKLHKIAMLMACMISTQALAWSNGDFNGSVDIGGSVTPEQYSQLWKWKVGTGWNNLHSHWEHMNNDKTSLTITVNSPKGLLYGQTVKAMTAYSAGIGVAPQISFSGYDNNPVILNQETTDAVGKGHITLPIKNKDGDQKIGTLKVNVTAVGLGAGKYQNHVAGVSAAASNNTHPLYGGLFPRPVSSSLHGSDSANNIITRFGGTSFNDIANLVRAHPAFAGTSWGGSANLPYAGSLLRNGYFQDYIIAASYVLGVDKDQTIEATFNNPITSTTQWSAPLNIAVTYN